MSTENRSFQLKIKAYEQAIICYRLRQKGHSIRQIAGLVGLDKMTVHRRLKLAKTMPICGRPRFCNFQWRADRNG